MTGIGQASPFFQYAERWPSIYDQDDDFAAVQEKRDRELEDYLRKSADNVAAIALPVGLIAPYAAAAAPVGWLLCDGGVIPSQWTALKTLLGGSNTPDLRNRFLYGAGTYGVGASGGEAAHILSVGEMPVHAHSHAHNHTLHYFSTDNPSHTHPPALGPANVMGSSLTPTIAEQDYMVPTASDATNAGSGVAHNNMPPYYVLTYIIRAQE